ncbi:prepilin-type N-terminal cleavage/methylation domain-containing protein [Blautia schinkii]|nr:prepilin-type N-terminal cleavage/methylation domain-containing protein [Blautia schinkii]
MTDTSDKRNKAFTLIELIIVVAVLAILIGLLAPQYTKYVEKSRRAVCDADINTIIKAYQVETIEHTPAIGAEAQALLSKIITSEGGVPKDINTTLDNGGQYTGICKSKGEYSCLFSDDYRYVSIKCSVHGELNFDVKTLKERIEGINFANISGWTVEYKSLDDYFKVDPKNGINRTSIDSEAGSNGATDSKYGKYGSLANALTDKLIEQGFNVTNRSWRMYKKGSTYNLFLTDKKITEDDAKPEVWISCEKYDIANEKIVKGKVQVIMTTVNGSTYPIIKGESFEPDS